MGTDQMLRICEQDGLDPAKVDRLFLTHAHADHAGGAASLQARLKLSVYAGPRTAKILSTGDEEAVSLPAARAAGAYPKDYVYQACPVENTLEPGEKQRIGQLEIEAIPTPGHSHDHHCYLVTSPAKRYLIGGDAIFFGGRIILQHTYDCSVPDTVASLQRLADYEFDALLSAHLNFSLNNGHRHIEAACAVIDQLGCPPSIF
jgi:glyoxylase-like metal-dependent hydrolase (beta-lactamase superfamily II)